MGTWGEHPFQNDAAADWTLGLETVHDLALVETALDAIERSGPFLELDACCNGLAACEVLARLLGNPGRTDSYTEAVDRWVAAHRLKPSDSLLRRASAAIDQVLGEGSELRRLWEDSDDFPNWRTAVEDLRQRLHPVMEQIRQRAYLELLAHAVLDIRFHTFVWLGRMHWWDPRFWRRAVRGARRANALADCFHNLARCAPDGFRDFREEWFWRDVEDFERRFPWEYSNFKGLFDRYLAHKQSESETGRQAATPPDDSRPTGC